MPPTNLRSLAEKQLGNTLEGGWSAAVQLIPPDGVPFEARGQVLYNTVRMDVTTGERVVYDTLVVTLRRSSLRVVPAAGENWIVEVPTAPVADAPIGQYALTPTRPPEGGAAIGFIRLYLQVVVQLTEQDIEKEAESWQ